MRIFYGIISVLVAGCASVQEAPQPTITPEPETQVATFSDGTPCVPPAGWEEIADRAEGKILVIGELHGTNEIPNAVANYACAVAARGGKTMVALEVNKDIIGSALEKASQSSDPRQVLLDSTPDHWRIPYGQGSEAWLDLMVKLSGLSNIVVAPMDEGFQLPEFETDQARSAWIKNRPPEYFQQFREKAMARNITALSQGYDRTIVLVGNLHARKSKVDFLPDTDLMAMLLQEDTLTLNSFYDGGEAWNVTSEGPGVKVVSASNHPLVDDVKSTPEMGWREDLLPAYDGYLFVGRLTASPPALADNENNEPGS